MGIPTSSTGISKSEKHRSLTKAAIPIDDDSDVDPDDLLPVYIASKAKLLQLQQSIPSKGHSRGPSRSNGPSKKDLAAGMDPEAAKLLRKIRKIEDDILFDQYLADQQWEPKRIQLEKEAAVRQKATESSADNSDSNPQESQTLVESEDEISKEATSIGIAMLEESGSDDDAALADLFASLPTTEVDPITGKSSTVTTGSNGVKVTIRDFGKWSGVNPTRVLEEACRARYERFLLEISPSFGRSNTDINCRDSSVKLNFTLISDSSFSNRHSLRVTWSKGQDFSESTPPSHIECLSSPKSQTFTMTSMSAPDAKQSEAYIATVALFFLFSSSTREEKVFLRLPPVWRDLWTEFAETKKEKADEADRTNVRVFRDMVREKKDQELEDGVLIHGAFRNRLSMRIPDASDESGPDKAGKTMLNPEAYQKIWFDKSKTQSYQLMLVCFLNHRYQWSLT